MILIPEQLITINEAIVISGYGRSTIQQWIYSGKLDAKQIGNVWVMDRSDVVALASKQPKMGRPRKDSMRGIA